MPKILGLKFQSHGIKIDDFTINPINHFYTNSMQGGVKMMKLLQGISYNLPKMMSSEFWSNDIKIEDFKISPINPLNSISTNLLNLLLGVFYKMHKMLNSKFQSHCIKI